MSKEVHETTYEYDDLDRLVLVRRQGAATVAYVYDVAGNRTAVEVRGAVPGPAIAPTRVSPQAAEPVAAVVASPGASPPPAPCRSCGASLPSTAKFCGHCGTVVARVAR